MGKEELAAVRLKHADFGNLSEVLPSTFHTLGIAIDDSARDGTIRIRDHKERGCVVVLGSEELAQRLARELAPRLHEAVQVFVVHGTSTNTKFKFRAAATEATPDGHLRDFSGVELDFDDPEQEWGGGSLEERANRVLREFGELPSVVAQEMKLGYKRRAAGKSSSPRVATLLALVKKARTWDGLPIEGGRVELKVELAKGGKQTSFCSAAEFEELQKLTGRGG